MPKFSLDYAEFYITHVCNYNCDHCNRLNNYRFSGHQNWKDYESIYTEWADRLELKRIGILGGEPTLNPTFFEWIKGISTLWPTTPIRIITNGTRLQFIWKDLYSILKQYRNIQLAVTAHSRNNFANIVKFIKEHIDSPFKIEYRGDLTKWSEAYKQVKDESWPECNTPEQFYDLPENIKNECKNIHNIDFESFLYASNGHRIFDTNNVEFIIEYAEDFVTAPIKYAGDNRFIVYDSDPEDAHTICGSSNCHHFVRGKLYKCHHVALLPEFKKQYFVDMSEDANNLLESYRPATVTDSDEILDEFINNLSTHIPQCRLCPGKADTQIVTISSTTIKPNIKKLNKL
jgi:organic radical activating enzyme